MKNKKLLLIFLNFYQLIMCGDRAIGGSEPYEIDSEDDDTLRQSRKGLLAAQVFAAPEADARAESADQTDPLQVLASAATSLYRGPVFRSTSIEQLKAFFVWLEANKKTYNIPNEELDEGKIIVYESYRRKMDPYFVIDSSNLVVAGKDTTQWNRKLFFGQDVPDLQKFIEKAKKIHIKMETGKIYPVERGSKTEESVAKQGTFVIPTFLSAIKIIYSVGQGTIREHSDVDIKEKNIQSKWERISLAPASLQPFYDFFQNNGKQLKQPEVAMNCSDDDLEIGRQQPPHFHAPAKRRKTVAVDPEDSLDESTSAAASAGADKMFSSDSEKVDAEDEEVMPSGRAGAPFNLPMFLGWLKERASWYSSVPQQEASSNDIIACNANIKEVGDNYYSIPAPSLYMKLNSKCTIPSLMCEGSVGGLLRDTSFFINKETGEIRKEIKDKEKFYKVTPFSTLKIIALLGEKKIPTMSEEEILKKSSQVLTVNAIGNKVFSFYRYSQIIKEFYEDLKAGLVSKPRLSSQVVPSVAAASASVTSAAQQLPAVQELTSRVPHAAEARMLQGGASAGESSVQQGARTFNRLPDVPFVSLMGNSSGQLTSGTMSVSVSQQAPKMSFLRASDDIITLLRRGTVQPAIREVLVLENVITGQFMFPAGVTDTSGGQNCFDSSLCLWNNRLPNSVRQPGPEVLQPAPVFTQPTTAEAEAFRGGQPYIHLSKSGGLQQGPVFTQPTTSAGVVAVSGSQQAAAKCRCRRCLSETL